MLSPWHFGNTTVRNPLRIRHGLSVLYNSPLNGNLQGKSQEILFADELDRSGVIEIKNKERDYSDFGRKWRSCFSQLGFITHKFSRNLQSNGYDQVIKDTINGEIIELSGKPYEITPSGKRMIMAETLQEQQECMLRALLAYEVPSPIEINNGSQAFNPFIFILQVLKELNRTRERKGLSKTEMAIVQIYRDHNSVGEVIREIFDYRTRREAAIGRVAKRRIDNELLQTIADYVGLAKDSMKDYADVNFRYPRLTGLLSFQGKRINFNDNKGPIIDAILDIYPKHLGLIDKERYLFRLWNGAELPTDNEVSVLSEISRYRELLIACGLSGQSLPNASPNVSIKELNLVRIRLEGMYHEELEKIYASKQRDEMHVREIIAYLKVLDRQAIDNEEFDIEIDDEPAFLEWSVWRAFLAINDLVNESYQARRFRIDQDFFPISCASGGGPDMIFEFKNYVLVVEVTLTSSSRQEAAEGEPVRRHVAKEKARVAQTIGKPVYGLFIARNIDNNTAETFRIGVWYNGDDPEFINIVPLTLSQFIQLMECFLATRFDNSIIRNILDRCLIPRNAHAPAWKKEISRVIEENVGQIVYTAIDSSEVMQ